MGCGVFDLENYAMKPPDNRLVENLASMNGLLQGFLIGHVMATVLRVLVIRRFLK